MSVTAIHEQVIVSNDNGAIEPLPIRWRLDEYNLAATLGIFNSHKRLELLDGEIIEYRSPVGSQHAAAMSLAVYALTAAFGQQYLVRFRFEQPLVMSDSTELQPDVAVVPLRDDHYAASHPLASDALLIIEVSDSTLEFDRGRKAAVYANALIPEYWILNLIAYRLEIHTEPERGFGYRTRTTLSGSDVVRPLCAPGITIGLASLMPTLRRAAL